VSFDIDANGILHVGAKDKGTGKENKITIKANSGLSEDEIQKMVKDAELNAEDDKKKLEIVQARNQGEAMVHSVKKSLGEYGASLEAAEKEKIEAAIKDVEEALKGEDKAVIEEKTNTLMTASQKLGEKMYADAAAAGASAASGPKAGAEAAAHAQAGRRQRGRRRSQGSQEGLIASRLTKAGSPHGVLQPFSLPSGRVPAVSRAP
jgi:molecular chaperone DnaK